MNNEELKKSEMTIYLVTTTDGNFIRRKDWVGPSLLKFYGGDLEEALQSKEALIDWVVNKEDYGEVAMFLCEIFEADFIGKALSELDAMPEWKYKKKVVPALLCRLKEPHDWENDGNYCLSDRGDISPYAS